MVKLSWVLAIIISSLYAVNSEYIGTSTKSPAVSSSTKSPGSSTKSPSPALQPNLRDNSGDLFNSVGTSSPSPSVAMGKGKGQGKGSLPTFLPSLSPSVSNFPSLSPSISASPTITQQPSSYPSVSPAPTTSTSPTVWPTKKPGKGKGTKLSNGKGQVVKKSTKTKTPKGSKGSDRAGDESVQLVLRTSGTHSFYTDTNFHVITPIIFTSIISFLFV